jgi:hypothetical protein
VRGGPNIPDRFNSATQTVVSALIKQEKTLSNEADKSLTGGKDLRIIDNLHLRPPEQDGASAKQTTTSDFGKRKRSLRVCCIEWAY